MTAVTDPYAALSEAFPTFDRAGNPIPFQQYEELSQDPEYKQVALWRGDDVTVSTVWLGWLADPISEPGVIFETMIFRSGDEAGCARYASEADALAGHEKIVAWVQAGSPDGQRPRL